MNAIRPSRASAVLALGFAPFVAAQAPAPPPLVDRAVGDLDPLATSMRRVDPAYGTGPSRDQLFRLESADPRAGTPGRFLLQAPEFRATFTQPDYLTLTPEGVDLNTAQSRDGAFIELIPPGTVFHLGEAPGQSRYVVPAGPDRRRFREGPIDGRLVNLLDAQPMDPRLTPSDAPPFRGTPGPAADPSLFQPGPAVALQPWVTAEDLREPQRLDPPIPDRVVMPGDPGVWTPDPPLASEPVSPDQPEPADAPVAEPAEP
ncbi:MAG: hypothetical protein AAGE65_00985 [Planctomycetota bacterium]